MTAEDFAREPSWEMAIEDAKARLVKLDRERGRLQIAIKLMRQLHKDGVPWPGTEGSDQGERG